MGMRRTGEYRHLRERLRRAIEQDPHLTNRTFANRFGVTTNMVQRLRAEWGLPRGSKSEYLAVEDLGARRRR